MSRSIDQDQEIRARDGQPAIDLPVSQGRAGDSSGTAIRPKESRERRAVSAQDANNPVTRLKALIERAAKDTPTMTDFIGRLEQSGVAVLPSLQSSGKLNGFSYRFEGITINGSRIGRTYTPRGLQSKKRVDYQPERDQAALASAAERGGIRRDPSLRSIENGRELGDPRTRTRESGLTQTQLGTLTDIGKFRTVAASDLVSQHYGGNVGRFERDMRELTERGLAERHVVTHGRPPKQMNVVVLTRAGKALLRRTKANADSTNAQEFYSGFVKPSEVPHDLGIYRMYQQERARIESEGGTVRRVVLDFELKKRVYRELNKVQNPEERSDGGARKKEIAEGTGLSVIEGRVVFPDLRIEYETRDDEMAKVDLELTTGHYKESQLAAKRAAGLKLYGPDSRLASPAHYDPEIVGGLVSL